MNVTRTRRRREEIDTYPQGTTQATIERGRVQIVRRIELLCALVLTVLIVFLHVYRAIHGGALWRDEVSTIATSTMPSLSGLWSSQIYSRPPVLPYLVVRIWTGIKWFGSSDASWRALGTLTGAGIVLALWFNTWLLGYRIPLVSLVLFGLNPEMIQWGDSPRGYGLGSLLILLVYGLIWKVVESPTTKRILLAALAAILSVQCLFQNAPLLFAICLGGSLVCLRMGMWKRMLAVIGIGALAALSLAPYLPIIRAYQSLNVIVRTTVGFSWILTVLAYTLAAGTFVLFLPWIICFAIAAYTAGRLIFAKQKDRREEGKANLAIFSLTVLVSGIAAFLVFSKAVSFEVHPWHFVPIVALMVPSIETLIELATDTIPGRLVRLGLVLLATGMTIPIAWSQAPIRQTNIDIIARVLKDRASPRDFVVVPWYMGVTFQHYYRGETAWNTIPPMQANLRSGFPRPDLLKQQMEFEKPLEPVVDAIEKALREGNPVWVVGELATRLDGRPTLSPPPAPNGPDGWRSLDYLVGWEQQVGNFIDSHAAENEEVNLQINQPVSPFENPRLRVFKGWRP